MADSTIDPSLYWLGVLLAVGSGILNNIGTVMQKKVVNDRKSDEKFMRSLIKNPAWFFGLLLQLAGGSVLFMLAQIYIGPALIPGLMALGLIVLAIGSVKIIGEKLGRVEVAGIALMMLGILFLGLSNMSIDLPGFDFLDGGFLTRTTIFTLALVVASIAFIYYQKRHERFRGILLALVSGYMFTLSNFWISPLMGSIAQVFEGTAVLLQWVIFITAAAILVVSNMYGISILQESYKSGDASRLIPIQQVPIQLAAIFVYFYIFLLTPAEPISTSWLVSGIACIITSTFLLGKQQARMESIKKVEVPNTHDAKDQERPFHR
jgi:drug/metabolite transporter (DMT)-like permease